MAMHPQAKIAIEQWHAAGLVVSDLSPEQIRQQRNTTDPGSGEAVQRIENRTIPGPDGQLPTRLYWPSNHHDLPILVWFHGGGWVVGNLDGTDMVCRALANRAEAIVMSVDYRLAPEHRFPAAAEDCYASTQWAADHATEIGGDVNRLAVGGTSAGGNLAAAVALMARDRKGPGLCHQLLVYPITDHDFDRPSYHDNAQGYCLTRETMIWLWDQYVPDVGQRDHPYVSTIKAEHLAGLPSAHIVSAEYDPLRDEGEAYAEALRRASVKVTCARYDGQIHGFFGRLDSMDDSRAAVVEAAVRLREDFT